MDPNLILSLIGEALAIGSAIVAIVIWTTGQFASRDRDLAAHKLYAAENFITKSDLNEKLSTMQATINKIDTRIDELLRIERHKDQS